MITYKDLVIENLKLKDERRQLKLQVFNLQNKLKASYSLSEEDVEARDIIREAATIVKSLQVNSIQ